MWINTFEYIFHIGTVQATTKLFERENTVKWFDDVNTDI